MKIFFLKEDSLYKIFKTLEKIPENKSIQIFIDPEHPFFENERWGKEIKEILNKKKIETYFITKTERHKIFFQNLGFKTIHQEQNKILKYINLFYMFFFNIKKFHLHSGNTKNFIFYLVSFFEGTFILGIIYMLYILILPSAQIKITPSHHTETVIYNFRFYPNDNINYPKKSRFLSIPYYTGFLDYKYEMTISSSHLKHIQNPSKGQIKIINTTNKEISLIPNTRFITDNGLLFQTLSWTKIPPAYKNIIGEKIITIKAMEKDTNNVFIGNRGNILKGTKLYIKNIDASFFLKKIYAVSIENFTGGTLKTEGKITQKDINLLSGELIKYLTEKRKYIVADNFELKNSILLPFNQLIKTNITEIKINNKINEEVPNLGGYAISHNQFYYIKTKDIKKAIETYLQQRQSNNAQLVTIDTNSLTFFNEIKKNENIIILPTKMNIIQGYDFYKDTNGVLEEIKNKILGQNKNNSKNIILAHPEISTVNIKIKPSRYYSIPKIKSRLKINIEKLN